MSPPGEAFEIRTAHATDLDDVAQIERASFTDPWSRRSFADLLSAGHVVFLVAGTGGPRATVVGYAVVLVAPPEAELANVAVASGAQRRGIGGRLLVAAIDAARERGCTDMWLEVRESNAAARALYGAAGFVEAGRRTRYYNKPVEDAIVMMVKV